jgi:hypothetical protein
MPPFRGRVRSAAARKVFVVCADKPNAMRSFGGILARVGCLAAVSLACGCNSMPTTAPSSNAYATRLYQGTYDEVWTATLKALNDYPLKISNKDSGRIQSEVVNGPYNDLLFVYPEPIEIPERFRYTLKFNFAKLVTDDREPLVRIRIVKELERFIDFYTGWLTYPSDGMEEKVILYRIEHILRMERAISGR